jgi:hypothetical protein
MTTIRATHLAGSLCDYFSKEILVEREERGLVALLPFKDPYGDSIRLYLDPLPTGGVAISDGGFAHHELAAITGATKADAETWLRVAEIARRFGVEFDGGELNTEVTSVAHIGEGSFAVSSAVTESLHYGRASLPSVAIQFADEVELFLGDHSVRFLVSQKLKGVSGAKHKVDFVLQNGSAHVAQAIASEQSMRRSLNIFYDLAETELSFKPLAFVDTEKNSYSNATFQQLAYKAQVFEWREKGRFLEYWAALH